MISRPPNHLTLCCSILISSKTSVSFPLKKNRSNTEFSIFVPLISSSPSSSFFSLPLDIPGPGADVERRAAVRCSSVAHDRVIMSQKRGWVFLQLDFFLVGTTSSLKRWELRKRFRVACPLPPFPVEFYTKSLGRRSPPPFFFLQRHLSKITLSFPSITSPIFPTISSPPLPLATFYTLSPHRLALPQQF